MRHKLLWLLPGLLALSVFTSCANKGMRLDQMKNRFEELGQLVAHMRQCSLAVDEPGLRVRLQKYASANGADAQEQASLLSYYEGAIETETRAIASTDCSEDDKTRNAALFNDKLNQFPSP
jgi:hypothetical protein